MAEATRGRFMAEIKVTNLNGSNERIETTVKASTVEDLKRKVTAVVALMDEEDL